MGLLVLYNESKHNILAFVGKANKNFKSGPSTYACESLKFPCAMTLWETRIMNNVFQQEAGLGTFGGQGAREYA